MLSFLYVLIYKTAARQIERMSAMGCANIRILALANMFKIYNAGI